MEIYTGVTTLGNIKGSRLVHHNSIGYWNNQTTDHVAETFPMHDDINGKNVLKSYGLPTLV